MTNPASLDFTQVAVIQVACSMLMARYAHASDQGDHEAFAATFAPDAEWVRLGGTHRMRGRQEIMTFLQKSSPPGLKRHVVSTIDVQVQSADRATGRSYTTIYRDLGWKGSGTGKLEQPEAVVEYEDDLIRVGDAWFFGRREARYVFLTEGGQVTHPR